MLTRAAAEALTAPMGPVSVEVPIDMQRMKIERPAMLDNFVLPLPPPRVPTAVELDELAARVLAAKRPMLWLGNGAQAAPARPAREAARPRLRHGQQLQRPRHGAGGPSR